MITPLSAVVVRLADAIGAARSLDDICHAALDGLRAVTGLERAAILLFDADGVMRFKAGSGLSAACRDAIEGYSPWALGDSPPEPMIVTDLHSDRRVRDLQPIFAQEDIAALAFIPVVSHRRVIGTFLLFQRQPDTFGRGEVPAVLAIAYQIGFAVDRMRTDHASTEARHRMLFALDAAQMGTWAWTIATDTVEWSENLERVHGLPPGTFTGDFSSYAKEVHPDDRTRVLASLQRALQEGTTHDVEYRIVAPNGVTRWVHGKGRLERDDAGRPVRMSGVCMDIGGRKRAEADVQQALAHEAALRQRLGRLTEGAQRLLTFLTPEMVVDEVIDLAESIVTADAYAVWRRADENWHVVASSGLSEAFAADVIQAAGPVIFDSPVIAEDVFEAPQLASRHERYRREGIASLMSIPLPVRGTAGGSICFYYRVRQRPSEVDLHVATALAQLAGAAVSNAELHVEQQRLRHEAEEAQLRSAFLAEASELLSSLDYQRSLERVAQLAVPRLSDWCAVDLTTEDDRLERLVVTHGEPAQVVWAHEIDRRYPASLTDGAGVGHVLRTGTPQLFSELPDELLVATANDAEHLRIVRELRLQSVMIVPLTAGRRTFGAITFVSSIGGRRFSAADLDFAMELGRRAALAVENARLYEEARNANRVKDEFLATLSHELRTPLNVIVGRARRLLDTDAPPEVIAQAAATIDRNAQMLTRLVEDLLDVSRFTLGQVTLDMRTIDVSALVQSVVTSLEPTARSKRILLKHQVSAGVPTLHGDQTRLQQVIWNLVTNAIKFTPEGGDVTVSTGRSGPLIELTVSDTGVGISPEFLPHVFEMFRQAERAGNRQYGGLGLGLSIVRRLIELHGGTVTAASPGLNQGATFTVQLPCGDHAALPLAVDEQGSLP